MGHIVLPTAADWATVDLANGLLLVEGRLAELLHPELWRDTLVAYTHIDQHPWDYGCKQYHQARVGAVLDDGDGWNFSGTVRMTREDLVETDEGSFTVMVFGRAATWNTAARKLVAQKVGAGAANQGYNFGYRLNELSVEIADGTSEITWNDTDAVVTLTAGRMHHFALSIDRAAETATVVVDGRFSDTKSIAGFGSFFRSTNVFTLGGSHTAGNFVGVLNDVRIVSRALSVDAVAAYAGHPNAAYECRVLPRVFLPTAGAGGTVSPSAIASAEAFGTARLNATIAPGGIASAEAFGTTALSEANTLVPTGIASAEAFGTLQLNAALAPSGIASAEAFGTAVLVAQIAPAGVSSEEAFGNALLAAFLNPTGIVTAEAFGTPLFTSQIAPAGVATGEAFGTASVVLVGALIPITDGVSVTFPPHSPHASFQRHNTHATFDRHHSHVSFAK